MTEGKSDQERRTPKWLFELLQQDIVKRKFMLDAAASPHNAHCKKFYTIKENGLIQPWVDPTFCNPGFSQFGWWIKKAVEECEARKIVACLIGPKGCSQVWFHQFARRGTIYAPDERLVYMDSQTGKPTVGAREDSMVFVLGPGFWNKSKTDFCYKPLSVRGKVVTL